MRRSWPLLALALTFVIPFFAAAALLLLGNTRQLNTTQHGIFINPQVNLTTSLADFDGNVIPHNTQWTIAFRLPKQCNHECQLQKQLLKNLHTALGKERKRVTLATSNQFPSGIESEATLVIINPTGQAVMYYTASHSLSGVLKDLRRLLKYSHAV
jgi:hypothetical protein